MAYCEGNITAVILAAGKSSRTWPISAEEGKGHKSSIKLGGKTILEHVIDEIKENTDIKDIIIVRRKEEGIDKEGIKEVIQHPPLGTGHALKEVYKAYPHYDKYLIVNAYHMFSGKLFKKIIEKGEGREVGGVLMLTPTKEIEKYGIGEVNEEGRVIRVIEKPKGGEINSNLRIVGIYLFSNEFMRILSLREGNKEDELERALDEYVKKRRVESIIINNEESPPSLKYAWEYLDFLSLFLRTKNRKYKGDANIKQNVIIDESNGPVYIGDNTTIYENAVIRGPAYIGSNVIIGNSSVIRESIIEDNSKVGAFLEVVRSVIQENVHIHSGYIGDSIISRGCRIGAGVITANKRIDRREIKTYLKGKKINTNKKSIGVIMGENVKVGIGVRFMPCSLIGKDSIIYPNAVIKGIIKDKEIIKTEIYTSAND